MIAGGFLVLLGSVGLALRNNRVQVEPDPIEDEHEPDASAGEQIFKMEGDLAQVEQTDSAKEQRRNRRAEREPALKEESDVGPEFYGKRSV